MNSKLFWVLSQLGSRLWLRAAIFCIGGIAIALLGVMVKDSLPPDLSYKIGAGSVDDILDIIASSMLAVTTFSLSIMVAAYATASSAATPRVTELLLSDTTSQNALSVFIGAFLFSLAAIVTLKIGIYGDNGRLVLFIVTIGVILSIVVMLLRWIDHLSRLGRIGHTIDMVEKQSRTTIARYIERPLLGCAPLPPTLPKETVPLTCASIGYVQNIDTSQLQKIAEALGVDIYLALRPGAFNNGVDAVLHTSRALDDKARDVILGAITINDMRSFTQDPRYCVIVLSEIASRALSPAVNDPGTAIDIIGTQLRLLAPVAQSPAHKQAQDIMHKNVFIPHISAQDLTDDAFMAIARDGAAVFEVCIRLQKVLSALADMPDPSMAEAATQTARRAFALCEAALTLETQRAAVREAAAF